MQDSATEIVARPTDDQDRVLVEHLTDSEKLTELLNYMRGFTDLMTQLAEQPMIGKMLGLPAGMFKKG
jgi:hypothetical protein